MASPPGRADRRGQARRLFGGRTRDGDPRAAPGKSPGDRLAERAIAAGQEDAQPGDLEEPVEGRHVDCRGERRRGGDVGHQRTSTPAAV